MFDFLPAPRLDLQRLPDPDVLGEVCPAAAAAIRAAAGHQDEALNLRAALESGRPGGAAWEDARTADRDLVLKGRPPVALGKLLAGDPQRYGAALAFASTCREVRQRARVEAVEAGLEAAVRAALGSGYESLRQRVAAGLDAHAGAGRVTSAVLAAEEFVNATRPRLVALQDALAWLAEDLPAGESRLQLPEDLLPLVKDLADVAAGRDPRGAGGWRARELAWMAEENDRADFDRRARPYRAAHFELVMAP